MPAGHYEEMESLFQAELFDDDGFETIEEQIEADLATDSDRSHARTQSTENLDLDIPMDAFDDTEGMEWESSSSNKKSDCDKKEPKVAMIQEQRIQSSNETSNAFDLDGVDFDSIDEAEIVGAVAKWERKSQNEVAEMVDDAWFQDGEDKPAKEEITIPLISSNTSDKARSQEATSNNFTNYRCKNESKSDNSTVQSEPSQYTPKTGSSSSLQSNSPADQMNKSNEETKGIKRSAVMCQFIVTLSEF